jgi:hypothetical protein
MAKDQEVTQEVRPETLADKLAKLQVMAVDCWKSGDEAQVLAVRNLIVAVIEAGTELRKTFDEKGVDLKDMFGADKFPNVQRIRKASDKSDKEVTAKVNPLSLL